MKRILIVLAAGFTIMSCKEADKTTDSNSPASTATSQTASVSKENLDSLNAISTAANNPSQSILPVETANLTTIKWLDGEERDFGKIKEGENLDVSFRFKNTGSKPLVISRVWAQCGCTLPETPQKPYAPGQSGVIKASFNSNGKQGTQVKEVYMSANTDPATSTLKFHVEVKAKS